MNEYAWPCSFTLGQAQIGKYNHPQKTLPPHAVLCDIIFCENQTRYCSLLASLSLTVDSGS